MLKRPPLSRLLNAFFVDRPRIAAAVRGRTGDTATDDVVQETWIKLAKHPSDAAIKDTTAFVRSVARNTATDFLRKERRRSSLDAEVRDLLWETEDDLSPERILIGRQAIAMLTDAIESLPAQTKRVFLMNRFDGMTHREISAELGISEPAVYYHIRRAFERLSSLRQHLPD